MTSGKNLDEHLDEGTIHAWFDGALSADEASEVEQHVTACESCQAAVAEARGLIAAASRILLSLDHVPGGVIPKAAPLAVRPVRRIPRWPLQALAAALLVAVGLEVATHRSPTPPTVVPTIAPVAEPLHTLEAPAPAKVSVPAPRPKVMMSKVAPAGAPVVVPPMAAPMMSQESGPSAAAASDAAVQGVSPQRRLDATQAHAAYSAKLRAVPAPTPYCDSVRALVAQRDSLQKAAGGAAEKTDTLSDSAKSCF